MNDIRPHLRPAASVALLCLLAMFLTAHALAASLSVRGEVGGIIRNTVVDIEVVEGAEYVPLGALARQLGIGFDMAAGRVRIDLAGRSALVHIDSADVDASTGPFGLSRPLHRRENDVLIAVSDLHPLLSKAFGLTLRQQRVASERDASRRVQIVDIGQPPAPEEVLGQPAAVHARKIEVVVLDPGHGGTDEGAVTPDGLAEKELTLAIAQKLKAVLEDQGSVKAVLTRNEDVALSDAQRVLAAQRAEGDLFVSLHAGVAQSGRTRGVTIFSNADQPGAHPGVGSAAGRRLARAVQQAAAVGLDTMVHPVRELPLRLHSKLGDMPAVLVEVGYLSNAAEAALLAADAHQQAVAEAIAAGIAAYVQEQEDLR